MKKLKLIYNPFSGDKSFRYDLDPCIHELQQGGYEISVFRSMKQGDIVEHIKKMKNSSYDALVICGGDGSVNITLNAMIENKINIPLGIIPSGTANDFARHLRIPMEFTEAAKYIAKGKTELIDIGRANDRYFINVCAAGTLTNISQNIDLNFKNYFGKLAYYIKGIEQLPNFVPMKLKITSTKKTYIEDVHFFCVLNSSGTGGFEKMSPGASIADGLFDFIAFKASPIHELAILMLKALTGDYLDDTNILFFRDSKITIEPLEINASKDKNALSLLETDLDGEAGPHMPVVIENLHKAFKIFIP